ncbi:zwei Ig domain protein zig-8-like [Artemia franciscana]
MVESLGEAQRSENQSVSLFKDEITSTVAQLGESAFLSCIVPRRPEITVSWVRLKDWRILTSETQVYYKDERFRLAHESPDTWTLVIKFVKKEDEGLYDCQMSTRHGVASKRFQLTVVVPEATILNGEDLFVSAGSPFTLTCMVKEAILPPHYVLWYHESRLLNYAEQVGPLHRTSAVVDLDPGPPTVSRLTVPVAQRQDSGKYTCRPSNAHPVAVQVHVAQGNEMAAIQATDGSGTWSSSADSQINVLHNHSKFLFITLVYFVKSLYL